MTTSARLAAFAAALAAVFALAFSAGRAAGPIDRSPGSSTDHRTPHGSAGDHR